MLYGAVWVCMEFHMFSHVRVGSQKHAVMRCDDAKFPIGVNRCVNVCAWCPLKHGCPVRGEVTHLAPSVPRIGSGPTEQDKMVNEDERMNSVLHF